VELFSMSSVLHWVGLWVLVSVIATPVIAAWLVTRSR
jgi:hypothetical protein